MEIMRVGVDATALGAEKTGVGNYIYSLLIIMVQRQSDWQFVLYSNQSVVFPAFSNVVIRVHTPYRKGPAWVNTQLKRDIYRDKLDVFWGGNGYLPYKMPNKISSVLTVHDLVYRQAGATMPWYSRWSRRIFQPRSVKIATKVVAVSRATASEMSQIYNRKPDSVINPQVDKSYGLCAKQQVANVIERLDLKEPYLLVLGTLEPRKNLIALIKAYLKVVNSGSTLPILAVAGGKGWLHGELPELVNKGVELGVIKKLGYVEQSLMAGLYAGAEAFIFPSLYEGFGMPVVEAQLCGAPALISNIASLNEASGKVACSFEPNQVSIETCLRNLANNKLPLICRLPETIQNQPEVAATKMLELLSDVSSTQT